jgi:hypothetical protein
MYADEDINGLSFTIFDDDDDSMLASLRQYYGHQKFKMITRRRKIRKRKAFD